MKIKKETNIYWGLLAVLVIGTLFLNSEVFFVFSAFYFLLILFQNGFKLVLPQVTGMKMFLCLIFIGFVSGCVLYSFRNVARDMLYFLFTLLWVLVGVNIAKKKSYSMQSVYKTLCLFAIIVSGSCLINFVISQNWGFDGIREAFVTGVYDIGFILPMMVLNSILNNNYAFSKKTDNFIIIVLSVHVFASIGRISILVPLLGIIMILCFSLKYKDGQKKNIKKIVILLSALAGIAVVIFFVIPEDVTMFFTEKIFGTFDELNSTQEFDSIEGAMHNWRGYEMQVALEQWKNSNLFQKIFGSGIGKGIHINYIPYSWADANMVENNEIPLLHNGFYTTLIKLGVVGTVSMLLIFVGTFFKALKRIKKSKYDVDTQMMLILLAVGGILYTYIANGLIGKTPFLAWGLLMGIFSVNKKVDEKPKCM